MITRASNNYGPHQFPEKLIPLMISNALPVYGDGLQVRDWIGRLNRGPLEKRGPAYLCWVSQSYWIRGSL